MFTLLAIFSCIAQSFIHCLNFQYKFCKKPNSIKFQGVLKYFFSTYSISFTDFNCSFPLPKQLLSKDIRRKLIDPQEVMPKGNEVIRRIKHVVSSEKGVPLWQVFFKGDKRFFMIRQSVVTYYWPVEAALFMTKLVHREQKRVRYLEKHQKLKEAQSVAT